MIQVFRDDRNNEYYALLSDFHINLVFPKYLLNIIKTEYEKKSKADQVLLEYLNVLESTYLDLKVASKSKD
jgi:predicted nucleic acid-binding protein